MIKFSFFLLAVIASLNVTGQQLNIEELKTLVTLWTDAGHGKADLFFVKTRDGKETDFLITKEGKPWILFEAKLSSREIESHHFTMAKKLGNIPLVQVVHEKNTIKIIKEKNGYIVSADRFF